MGCSSSAPFAADGGALGEVKNVADDLIETGEHAVHDMGEAAGKAVHETIDHVKDGVSKAVGGVTSAVDNVGTMASNATHSISEGIKRETSVLTAPANPDTYASNGSDPDGCKHIPLKAPDDEMKKLKDVAKDMKNSMEQSPTSIEGVPPLQKFRPTPAPSFDKPPSPGKGSPLEKPMDKIDEVNSTIDQLTDELLKETEAIASDVTAKVNETAKKELPPLDIIKAKMPSLDKMKTEIIPLPPIETMKSEMDNALGEKVNDSKTVMTNVVDNILEAAKEAAATEMKEGETNGMDGTVGNEELDDFDVPPTKWEALADAIVELPPRMSIDLGTGQLYIVEDEPSSKSSRSRPSVLKEQSSAENLSAKGAL